jgi:hypothetical protein
LGIRRFLGEFLKLVIKSGFSEKYEMFDAKAKHSSVFLKLFSEC